MKSGFEESIWIRPAGGMYSAKLILHAHIDDALIGCANRPVLNAFKKSMLQRFDSTDEGPVTQHLGCEIIRDRQKRTITMRQKGYAERVLRLYGFWDKPTVMPGPLELMQSIVTSKYLTLSCQAQTR